MNMHARFIKVPTARDSNVLHKCLNTLYNVFLVCVNVFNVYIINIIVVYLREKSVTYI